LPKVIRASPSATASRSPTRQSRPPPDHGVTQFPGIARGGTPRRARTGGPPPHRGSLLYRLIVRCEDPRRC
jgi:hypothetical protein